VGLVHVQGWNVATNDVAILDKVKGKSQKKYLLQNLELTLLRSSLGDA